ncbi:abortive infection family protein [Aerococcus sp. UMB7834]|uniref:abortive infection family protein n=1 Tax=Aerococcus sp. UMB7834 TaxID=3046342 RepID=UPI00254A01E2|nr:abortive infection family protein [Aerococcus sp. UMB7834]MDK6805107.1 abortive infection family protein [Aerococcus sp. UMB7834]
MANFDIQDTVLFENFFDTSGYVFDFSNERFQWFTTKSVNINIQKKYQLSKGKSLVRFINDEEDISLVVTLLSDLLDYYNGLSKSNRCRTDEMDHLAKKVGTVLDKYKSKIDNASKLYLENSYEKIREYFDKGYSDEIIAVIESEVDRQPTFAIGKSKELLEACFKHILDDEGIEYSNSADIGQLQKKVFKQLDIDVKDNLYAQDNQNVKQVLTGLNQIVKGINGLRNARGDGHGKGRGYKSLPPRYAALVASSTFAIVSFVLDTYEKHKTQ